MYRDQAEALCAPLLEEAKAQIRHDRRHKARTVNVQKMLAGIEKDLVDPDLKVEELRRRCGGLNKNVSTPFTRDLGLGPSNYILWRRMQIAARALEKSTVQAWRIGVQVGYLTYNSFSRAFKQWCKKSPEEFREEATAGGGAPPASGVASYEDIQQAVAGELPAADAQALVGSLVELQAQIAARYHDLAPPPSDVGVSEAMMAAYLWRCIELEPYEVQTAAVDGQAAAFSTPALFQLLCSASFEAEDAERKEQLARLAVIALETVAERLGPGAAPYLVRAHAMAGSAFCRAGRMDDAARTFADALGPLEMMNDAPNAAALLELTLHLAIFDAELGNVERARDRLRAARMVIRDLIGWVRELRDDAGRQE